MIYIRRNNHDFGPYDLGTIQSYVNNGQVLLCDEARDSSTGEENSVKYFLKKAGIKTQVVNKGNIVSQLKDIGSELIIPKNTIVSGQWIKDKSLLALACVGLLPLLLGLAPFGEWGMFYLISLYFAAIWGVFFYYLFKTSQVSLKTTLTVFFVEQVCVFLVWDVLGLSSLNIFYGFTELIFPLDIIGYVLGVGLTEEFGKLIPLLIISARSRKPLLPQTLVFYGLISGIAFGVWEGVDYQLGVNSDLEYSDAFFYNIARLTSLPFMHAIWCGIAGYFIAFAKLYPKYRRSLYFLALAVPATLHGLYDSFAGQDLLVILGLGVSFVGVILLMTYLKQGVNYQSKLRK